ncbi:MAG: hypothetical protein J0M00_22720 [Burkholderiales bacterium]|nr:hypothetical protein [Burkholderiales bacterium]
MNRQSALQVQRSTIDGAHALLPATATLPDPRLIVARSPKPPPRRPSVQGPMCADG